MDAFGFGVYAPFVPVLAKTFSLQLHDIATVLAAQQRFWPGRGDHVWLSCLVGKMDTFGKIEYTCLRRCFVWGSP